MPGKPQRDEPKAAVQLRIDETAYRCVLPLIRGEAPLNMSFSRLLETILLLAKNEYTCNTSRDFVEELCRMKKKQVEETIAIRDARPQRRVHVTIDHEALGFLDMLVTRYRSLFRTRGIAASLVLRRFGERLATVEQIDWMKRRIEEIFLKYPVRY